MTIDTIISDEEVLGERIRSSLLGVVIDSDSVERVINAYEISNLTGNPVSSLGYDQHTLGILRNLSPTISQYPHIHRTVYGL